MKLFKFIWCFVKHLITYTLSVIPASFVDAKEEAFGPRIHKYDHKNYPVRFEGPSGEHHRKNRRGRRGGKKHHHRGGGNNHYHH